MKNIVLDQKGIQYRLANPNMEPIIIQHAESGDWHVAGNTFEESWQEEIDTDWVNYDLGIGMSLESIKAGFIAQLKRYDGAAILKAVEDGYDFPMNLELVVAVPPNE